MSVRVVVAVAEYARESAPVLDSIRRAALWPEEVEVAEWWTVRPEGSGAADLVRAASNVLLSGRAIDAAVLAAGAVALPGAWEIAVRDVVSVNGPALVVDAEDENRFVVVCRSLVLAADRSDAPPALAVGGMLRCFARSASRAALSAPLASDPLTRALGERYYLMLEEVERGWR